MTKRGEVSLLNQRIQLTHELEDLQGRHATLSCQLAELEESRQELESERNALSRRHAALIEAAKKAQYCLRRAISLYEPDNLTQQSHVKQWSIADDNLTKALEANDGHDSI